MTTRFRAMTLDDSPQLLEASYRLRYQVYCLERKFLPAENYPNHLEIDGFDRDSIHVGVIDVDGTLAGTARVIRAGSGGLPLFRHCILFPHVTTFADPGNIVVEVSRVSISRQYSRRRNDPPLNGSAMSQADADAVDIHAAKRRQRFGDPFLTLLKAVIYAAKHAGATHLIGATDAALHRWLVHFGFPYRLAGPEVDYYGLIAPYIMSLADLDQVILGRRFSSLEDFPVGMDPALWPKPDEPDEAIACPPANEDRLVHQ